MFEKHTLLSNLEIVFKDIFKWVGHAVRSSSKCFLLGVAILECDLCWEKIPLECGARHQKQFKMETQARQLFRPLEDNMVRVFGAVGGAGK